MSKESRATAKAEAPAKIRRQQEKDLSCETSRLEPILYVCIPFISERIDKKKKKENASFHVYFLLQKEKIA